MEFMRNANCRYNFKTGATRSGKSYMDIAFMIPFRIRERAGKAGLNVIMGVTKSTIERNVLQPMREIVWISSDECFSSFFTINTYYLYLRIWII